MSKKHNRSFFKRRPSKLEKAAISIGIIAGGLTAYQLANYIKNKNKTLISINTPIHVPSPVIIRQIKTKKERKNELINEGIPEELINNAIAIEEKREERELTEKITNNIKNTNKDIDKHEVINKVLKKYYNELAHAIVSIEKCKDDVNTGTFAKYLPGLNMFRPEGLNVLGYEVTEKKNCKEKIIEAMNDISSRKIIDSLCLELTGSICEKSEEEKAYILKLKELIKTVLHNPENNWYNGPENFDFGRRSRRKYRRKTRKLLLRRSKRRSKK